MDKEEIKNLNKEAEKGTEVINKIVLKLLESEKILNKEKLKEIEQRLLETQGESKKIK